jgi:trans-aconitate 2-methyltransferase
MYASLSLDIETSAGVEKITRYLDVKRNEADGMWDPAQYLNFADERSRPFFDLTRRITAQAPDNVVDLGCGPGNLTETLVSRWPSAQVEGIDSSAEMIDAAKRLLAEREGHSAEESGDGGRPGRLSFRQCDVTDWKPDRPVDVIVSNAVLQWVPSHLDLLPDWAAALASGGWLAFQLPGNFDQPTHAFLRELASSDRWRQQLAGVPLNRQSADPSDYLHLLAGLGLSVDAWETTYLHVLAGPDPVTEWYKGSGLRPVLAALPPADAAEFVTAYSERVRSAYPAAAYGTVLPFRRVFVVARKP